MASGSWDRARRSHRGELFPRVGFIVFVTAGPRFYNGRGTAEQWIKEQDALNWTRLSIPTGVLSRLQPWAMSAQGGTGRCGACRKSRWEAVWCGTRRLTLLSEVRFLCSRECWIGLQAEGGYNRQEGERSRDRLVFH